LVENTKAKYSIQDKDTYNFNKSSFIIGVILTGAIVTGSKQWTSIIQGICAKGWSIPPFIIFSSKHHLST
ncbi:uncharacterized protein M421DRAFT_77768, partial [Didymella exigua CBS 183.55]